MVIHMKKNTKKVIIICIVIILLFLITIILVQVAKKEKNKQYLENEQQRVKQYTSITDFKNMQEVAFYLDCTLIKQIETQQENIQYNIYMEIPIKPEDNGKLNKNYYENLIQYSAYVLKYKNFAIIDEKNEISIQIYCNEQESEVSNYFINNIENYFNVKQSEQNVENFTEINQIQVNVNSNELKNIINNNWKTEQVELGTKETTYKGYDIYFEEGIELRKIQGKLFNIVFTEKYKENIVNNLTTNSSKQEIEKNLGKPHFEEGNIIGYKCNNMYLFFYNKQVSIYPIETYNTQNIANIIEKYETFENVQAFINEVKSEWKDYDIYEYSSNNVLLQYTLKGLCIKFDSTTKSGVVFYNNFNGNAYGNMNLQEFAKNKNIDNSYIHIENSNLVFETELNRIYTRDDSTNSYNNATNVIMNTSKEFKVITNATGENEYFKLRFVSIGNKYANSELRENCNKGIWADEFNFIYSVHGSGIYVYNVLNFSYKTLVSGNEKFNILGIEDGVLYFDNSSLKLK